MTATIKYVDGDASCPVGEGSKIIVHVVNDVGVWGSGFVVALSRKWPRTRGKYLDHFREYGLKPGEVQFCVVEAAPSTGQDLTVVASIVGQRGLISKRNPHPFDSKAFEEGLRKVAELALKHGATIHMPKIGTGRGGATWEEVLPIVTRILTGKGIDVAVYSWSDRLFFFLAGALYGLQ